MRIVRLTDGISGPHVVLRTTGGDVPLAGSIADLLEEDPLLASHLYHSLAVTIARRLRDRNANAQ